MNIEEYFLAALYLVLKTIFAPYRDSLIILLHENSFLPTNFIIFKSL